MHTLIHQHTGAAAVVHTDPLQTTTLSVLVDELPTVHHVIALRGGLVRVAPYTRYGSQELAENSLRA
jgi:L-fuculose-phosphate aldolase